MTRSLRLVGIQMRASFLLAMQYRIEFVVGAIMTLFWTGASIVPLIVLFSQRPSIVGWSRPEALLVVAWFTVLKGILDGVIQPGLQNVVEMIRTGKLDFLLLKPADAQFLVSTSRFELFKGANVVAGLGLAAYALRKAHVVPSIGDVASTALLLLGGCVILYSIWILVVSLAFRVVKIDNLSFLFASVYDAARWPSTVFRGFFSILFTFVVPLAVMTTYPALAIIGKLSAFSVAFALLGAAAFAGVARLVWLRSIGHYTSAGG